MDGSQAMLWAATQRRHCVRADFASDPRLIHMIDETARRFATTPGRWLTRPDDDPIVALWLDLLLSRACAAAAVETQRQFLQRNSDGVMWTMPIPGS